MTTVATTTAASTDRNDPNAAALEHQTGRDPRGITLAAAMLIHADKAGFTVGQIRRAIRWPRWVAPVMRQPPSHSQRRPRVRYCGAGVAVIVEGDAAIAVIADDPGKGPRYPGT